jgi:hypothetical protein
MDIGGSHFQGQPEHSKTLSPKKKKMAGRYNFIGQFHQTVKKSINAISYKLFQKTVKGEQPISS